MRTVLLSALGWFGAVVLATAVGIGAITLVSAEVGAPIEAVTATEEPTTSERDKRERARERRQQRSGSGSSSSSAGGSGGSSSGGRSGSGGSSGSSATQVTDGGSVTARCSSGAVRLTTWAPANGWSVTGEDLSGSTHGVVFEDGTSVVSVRAQCLGGGPVFSVSNAPETEEPVDPDGPTDPDDPDRPGNEPSEAPSEDSGSGAGGGSVTRR
jgi:hypothetical protein